MLEDGGKKKKKGTNPQPPPTEQAQPAQNMSMSHSTQPQRDTRSSTQRDTRSNTQPLPIEQAQLGSSRPDSFIRGGRNVTLGSSLEKWLGKKKKQKGGRGKDVNI